MKASGTDWILHHGDYATALADATVSTVLCDPPYSARTHVGHNDGATTANSVAREADYAKRTGKPAGQTHVKRNSIDYGSWTPDDVMAFVQFWAPRTRRWIVGMTDDTLNPAWKAAFRAVGWYDFARVPYVVPGMGVRYSADGPANWACDIMVGRPRTREAFQWRALPGAYVLPPGQNDRSGGAAHGGSEITGGKTEWIMRRLVEDYSNHGDLICDPCCGAGTTGVAALREGRRFIGSEIRREAFDKSVARLSKPMQISMFVAPTPATQPDLF